MALIPRKPEVEEVAEAIKAATSDGLDAAAKASIKASFTILQRRQLWIIATDAHLIYGPYESEAAAYNALAGGKVPDFEDEEGIKAIRKEKEIPTLGGRAIVLPIIGPLALAEGIAEKDAAAFNTSNHLCVTCGHKLLAHGLKRSSNGCSVRGCTCSSPKTP